MNHWPINDATAKLLEERMQANPPRLALDVGSGRSTVIMAQHAKQTFALEHVGVYCALTLAALKEAKVSAMLLRCAIRNYDTPAGELPWYDVHLPFPIDFALIDGPPQAIGREAGLHLIYPHLAKDWEIWLDDWDREHEQNCVRKWLEHYPMQIEELSPTLVKLIPE